MKILLACAGGMSSAIAAKSLKEAAAKEGLDFEVHESSSSAFENEIAKDYDLALIAPQIRHRYDDLKKIGDKAEVPVLLIKPQGYTPIGGPFLLKQIKSEASELF
ncbi:PTS sugar transporter subunit IIB [Aerococcus kribbianus]|uniref:PTS sugar transporter subunit IIB n=1 Tax=Aerococcus kribbianus TaxID=2999064 RepID=A0A9X3FLT0_9LACT|nr:MULTISPECIES: PTS sugar transporter subunit IIB [unclassified Aerococcus]MCZ0716850.1 PTS sugar transporter subunit IIB [Aerococcus sp. YH-aer221]MCZ0725138.1 PTS sugar transporter subunit IIB [Aerococcus sp. YH-aer222]